MAPKKTVLVVDTGVDQVRRNTNFNQKLGRREPLFIFTIRISTYVHV